MPGSVTTPRKSELYRHCGLGALQKIGKRKVFPDFAFEAREGLL